MTEKHHGKLDTWLSRIAHSGRPYAEAVREGTASAVLYKPGASDGQSAHDRAEAYVVVRGAGTFHWSTHSVDFGPGDLLYVAAGAAHWFSHHDPDLVVWAVFFGPSMAGEWVAETHGTATLTLELTPPSRAWRAKWPADGGPGHGGIAMVVDDQLVMSRDRAGRASGTVAYQLDDSGGLDALWAHSAILPTAIGGGHARRTGGAVGSFAGAFTIAYTDDQGNPAPGPPQWDLQITDRGDRFELAWSAGATRLVGHGLLVHDDRLLAAWGADGGDLALELVAVPRPGDTELLAGHRAHSGGVEAVSYARPDAS